MSGLGFYPIWYAAWARFRATLGPLILASLIVFGLAIACGFVRFVVHGLAGLYAQEALRFLVVLPLSAGLSGMCLIALRGRQTGPQDLFDLVPRAGHVYLAWLLPTLVGLLALAALLPYDIAHLMNQSAPPTRAEALHALHSFLPVAAILFSVGLLTAPLLLLISPALADHMSGPQALIFSLREGVKHWPVLFVINLAVAGVGIVVTTFTCTLGALAVMPWSDMVGATAYLAVRGKLPAPPQWPAPQNAGQPPLEVGL